MNNPMSGRIVSGRIVSGRIVSGRIVSGKALAAGVFHSATEVPAASAMPLREARP